MKIGLLIPEFPTQTHVAMWRVGQAMRELGVEVQMMSTRRPASSQRCHPALVEESRRTYYAWPPRTGDVLGTLARSPGAVARAIGYAGEVRESGARGRMKVLAMIPAAAGLAGYCRREGIGHIFAHSCADAAHLVALSERMGGPAYSLRLGGDLEVYGKDHRAKMARATVVVAAARVNKEQVHREVGLPEERVIWSWLGVDTRRFVPREGARRDGVLHLVTVARINGAKGHVHALRGMRRALDAGARVEYTIAGAGPHEGVVREEIERLGLAGQVRMVGPLGEDRVLDLLQSADAFILPTVGIGEGSPVAVIEAMSCGVAVICSRIGGTAEMIDDGVDGLLVEPGDEGAIAEALVRLWEVPGEAQRLGRAARARAEREFDCRRVAERILERIGVTVEEGAGATGRASAGGVSGN